MTSTSTADRSPVVQQALDDAKQWIGSGRGPAVRAVGFVGRLSRRVVSPVLDAGPVHAVVGRVTVELAGRLQDALADVEVRPSTDDLVEDLRVGDRTAERVGTERQRSLVVRGAAAGAASVNPPLAVAAVVTDVIGSTLGLTRTAAEVLAGYGEDHATLVGTAIAVVDLAAEPDRDERRRRLHALVEHVRGIDERDVAGVLSEQVGTRLLNEALESVVRRRTQQAVVRSAPLVGAAVGGLTAGVQVARTVEAARHVARLRRIERDAPSTVLSLL